MFEHQSKCKAMALTLVAMLAFCSVSVMLTDTDAAANNNETYDIHMRVGETFTYTPEVNLTDTSGDITIAVDTGSSAGMSDCFRNGVFTFTPSDSGNNPKVIFKATWTSGSLIQYAYQTIQFHVWDKLAVSGGNSVSKAISTDCPIGQILYTPVVTGGINTYTFETDIPAALQNYIEFSSENKLVTKSVLSDSLASTTPYTITIKVSDQGYPADPDGKSNELAPESVTVTLKLTISNNYVIITDVNYFETFKGSLGDGEVRADSFTVSTNSAGIGDVSGETITVNAVDSDNNTVTGLVSYSDGKVTVDLSKVIFTNDQVYRDYTVRISATATSSSLGSLSATKNVGLRVFEDLSFISEPSITPGSAQSVSNNPMDMILTATFENATKITYYWGDGEVTSVNTNGSDKSTYSARHIYASPDVYYITVQAENERGTSKMITMYNAFNGNSDPVEEIPEKGFIDEHGYQFMIFAIIAIVCLAAFFLLGAQNPLVIIIAIIAGTLAVLSYMYYDLAGVLEALRGLF